MFKLFQNVNTKKVFWICVTKMTITNILTMQNKKINDLGLPQGFANKLRIWEYPLCWNPKVMWSNQNALHLSKLREFGWFGNFGNSKIIYVFLCIPKSNFSVSRNQFSRFWVKLKATTIDYLKKNLNVSRSDGTPANIPFPGNHGPIP